MRTIAFVSQKGGAGKTTLATCLAVAAIEAGERVIALDLDPQGSFAMWGEDREGDAPSIKAVSASQLARINADLAAYAAQGYTLAVLDCAGTASSGVNLAMKAADLCLIPVRPTKLDIRATRPTVEALMGLKHPFSFVLNACPTGAVSSRAREAAVGLSLMGGLMEPPIMQRTVYFDAYAAGQGVTEYEPNGKAALEIRQLWTAINAKLKGK